MKKVSLLLVMVGLVILSNLIFPYIVSSDCGSWRVRCCIKGDITKTVGITEFSMCYDWKSIECKPCHGGGKWSYLSQWCNNNYKECDNNCWACVDKSSCCFDKNGDPHECYDM